MSEMRCGVCGKELTGGLDTFGEHGLEVCQEHWLELQTVDGQFVKMLIEKVKMAKKYQMRARRISDGGFSSDDEAEEFTSYKQLADEYEDEVDYILDSNPIYRYALMTEGIHVG